MMRSSLLGAFALAATLLLAACGTGTDDASWSPPAASSAMPDMPAMAAAPAPDTTPVAVNTVRIENFAFGPNTVTVKVGSTVTWTNADTDPHTVTSTGAGGPLRSPTLNQGATFSHTFTEAGHFDYLCTIHPFMTGTVVVTP